MNNIQQKHIVVVLGMHRSGTSVITRGLEVIGINLGDHLLSPAADNRKGFWEDVDINALNIDLLRVVGHDWHTLTPVLPDELASPAVGEFKLRAVEILRNKLSTTNCFGLKDPRIPRLLPFWQDVFAHLQVRVSYVIACRNPMSVARSLAKRDGFDLEKGYYLWLEHMLQSLVQTANQPRIVVDYDRLMEDPTGQLQRIAQNLGLTFDSESPEFAEYHTQFLEDSLRHTRYRMEDLHLDKSIPPIVIELYKILVELATDAVQFEHREVVSLLRRVSGQFRENYPALRYMQACDERAALFTRQVIERDARLVELDNVVAELEDGIAAVLRAMADSEEEVHHLARIMHSLEDEQGPYAGLVKTLIERNHQIVALHDSVRARDAQIADLNQVVMERDTQIVDLRQTTRAREERVSALSQAVHDKDWEIGLIRTQIASVYSSRSWRLTAPLREFVGALRRNGITRSSLRKVIVKPIEIIRSVMWKLGRRVFRRLPLGIHTKTRISRFARKYLEPRPWEAAEQASAVLPASPTVPHPNYSDPSARKPFAFPAVDVPLVSVIIPVYNKSDYTYACLRSIYDNPPAVAFEIIIVDDCSTDDTRELLGKIGGIQLLCNDSNLGFVRTSNRGAGAARGQYLLFLNNDTLVHPLWMDELFAVLSTHPEIGLVGSQLIYADGRLQESGCLTCQDGTSIPLGRLQSPNHPEFSYFREVDFCSGASILVRKSDFMEIGGFDLAYAPAYYEDPDLAFKLHATGKRIFVQPLSKVTHFEGISHGEKAYSELVTRNKDVFIEKWAPALAQRLYTDVQDYKSNRRHYRERVLYIDALVPVPDRGAGSVDAYYFMKFLLEAGYDVVFYGEHTPDFVPKYTPMIQRIGVECLYRPYIDIEEYLSQNGASFSYVLVARVYQAVAFERVLEKYCPHARYIFNTVDVHFLREFRQAEVEKSASLQKNAELTQKNELRIMSRADATIVISAEEKTLLEQQYGQQRIHHIPLIREVYGCKYPFNERHNIVFIGSAHGPNVDAVLYFYQRILPLIRYNLPQLRLIVIGAELRDALSDKPGFEELATDPYVDLVGFVEDLSEYFDHVRLMVAPLRYGSGVKGKIATALSYGVPCVSSRIGVEGMGLEDEVNILEAEDPDAFARAVVRAYTTESLWEKLSENGLTFMESNYSLSMGKRRLLEVFELASAERTERPSLSLKRFGNYEEYSGNKIQNRVDYDEWYRVEKELIPPSRVPFFVVAFCALCGDRKPMRVTFDYAHQKDTDGRLIPNWRESLVCECGLNNRLRASIHLFTDLLKPRKTARIYLTEHVTPLAAWMRGHFLNVTTSEYLGMQLPFGSHDSSGVRNESLTSLSFPTGSVDFILSFDVFEHIPDFRAAFAESARVLAEGGALFFSVPFRSDLYEHQIRAVLDSDDTIRHLLEPEYHGDPVGPNGGVLCYQVFGWQILDDLRVAGFSEVEAVAYWSREYGYLGGEQILFLARREKREIGS